MEHLFELPLQYNGKKCKFPVRLAAFGSEYKYYVFVDDKEIVFTNDGMNYRVVKETAEMINDPELLHAIIIAMSQLEKINDLILLPHPANAA